MKLDEKACPQCAEAIKKPAIVCRYCGYQFPAEQVAEIEADSKKTADEKKLAEDVTKGCGALIVLIIVGFVIYTAIFGSAEVDIKNASDYDKSFGLQVGAEAAVRKRLKDPGSAVFEDLRFNIAEYTVCGKVNSKNSFGALAGNSDFAYDLKSETVLFDKNIENDRLLIKCVNAYRRENLSK